MKRIYFQPRNLFPFVTALFLALSFFISPARAESTAEELYRRAKSDYLRLKESNQKQKYRDQWERVIYGFAQVADRFPDSARADDALYNCGMISLSLREFSRASRDSDSAIKYFERLAREYPNSRYADDAQYMIGEIYRTIKESPEEAYLAYAAVPERFPKGDMAGKARNRMSELPAPIPQPVVRAKTAATPKVEAPVQEPAPASQGKVRVTGIRHWVGSDYVRVVLDLDGPVAFEQHRLPSPPRIYVDLKNAILPRELETEPIPVAQGYLKSIRLGQFNRETTRVVLDFEKIRNVSIFPLSSPDRIVMDVAGEESANERFSRIRGKASGQGRESLSLSEQLGMKVAKVVIDPGHGGKDPGCIGKSGLMEKDVTLDLALRLKKRLEEELSLQVVLTRDRDVYVPLDERTAIANREKADLFISVHVNAAENRSLAGVETWFLDLAASERAKKIAARENMLSNKPMSDLDLILNDLLFNNKTQESSRLAELVQETLIERVGQNFKNVQSLGVKGAPFVVLVGARMPSVLIEVAFISNPTEEKRLTRNDYRDALAHGLVQGVHRYVNSSEYALQRSR